MSPYTVVAASDQLLALGLVDAKKHRGEYLDTVADLIRDFITRHAPATKAR